jgi:DNA-directed RNA polymerase specialized sigma24 family protein
MVLTRRQAIAVRLRRVDRLTQTEIAFRMGCSQPTVSKLLAAATKSLEGRGLMKNGILVDEFIDLARILGACDE